MEILCQLLQNISPTNPDIPIWIAGDINLPNVDWESLYVVNNAYPIDICKTFTEFVLNHGFTQIVQPPMRGETFFIYF